MSGRRRAQPGEPAGGEEKPVAVRAGEEKGLDRHGTGGGRSQRLLNSLHCRAPSKYNGAMCTLQVSSSHTVRGEKGTGEIHFDNII